MPKTRNLADLYVRGALLNLNDGDGDPVPVWIQKLTPIEHEKAVRKASAYRARLAADIHDEASDFYQAGTYEIEQLTREELVSQLATTDVTKRRPAIEAEIEAEEKWAEDGYLQGLYDSWNEGLREVYATDPEDPEAKRVFDGMNDFLTTVEARVVVETKHAQEEWDTRPIETLQKKATEAVLMSRIDMQWMGEFRRCQVWLSVREPENHRTYYFGGRAEVDELAQQTLIELIRAYTALEVENVEGKGSEVTQGSSS